MDVWDKLMGFFIAVMALTLLGAAILGLATWIAWYSAHSVGPSDVMVELDGRVFIQRVEKAWIEKDRVVLHTTDGEWNLPADSVRFAPKGKVQVQQEGSRGDE